MLTQSLCLSKHIFAFLTLFVSIFAEIHLFLNEKIDTTLEKMATVEVSYQSRTTHKCLFYFRYSLAKATLLTSIVAVN